MDEIIYDKWLQLFESDTEIVRIINYAEIQLK